MQHAIRFINRALWPLLAIAMIAGCGDTTTPEIGAETVPDNEARDIARVIDLFKAQVERRDGGNQTRRGAHPKHHACVHAELTVPENLAADLHVGLFRPGVTYPALIRFSNNADPQPDQVADVRGMAVKLFDVPGPRLFQPDPTATTHDLLLVSHPVFLFEDVATYLKAFAAFDADRALNFFFNPFDSHLRAFLIVREMLANHADLLAIRWFSMVPYRFGTDRAVKYAASPCRNRPARSIPPAGDDFLGQYLRDDLSRAGACFDVTVQFQTDAMAMPIEDPTRRWSEQRSPPVTVARLEIPRQTVIPADADERCENLSFNPWRARPEHQPLGGISRARRVIYEAMSDYRHARNKIPPAEPRSPYD